MNPILTALKIRLMNLGLYFNSDERRKVGRVHFVEIAGILNKIFIGEIHIIFHVEIPTFSRRGRDN